MLETTSRPEVAEQRDDNNQPAPSKRMPAAAMIPPNRPLAAPTAVAEKVRCKSGHLLCLNNAVADCIMCGRAFCSQHGNVEQGVCRRCRHDYARRLQHEEAAYMETIRREVAESRNAHGLCGNEGCDNSHIVMCERCGTLYCAKHWGRYSYTYDYRTRTGIKRKRAVSVLCTFCKSHLSDYRKLSS